MAAPAAAPINMPTTPLATALLFAACAALVPPVWSLAYWRHTMSSARNSSKLLPEPGYTATRGPTGAVAHPTKPSINVTAVAISLGAGFIFISIQINVDQQGWPGPFPNPMDTFLGMGNNRPAYGSNTSRLVVELVDYWEVQR
jgi:hypothetical protein